ncbi:MAG: class I SAM-dependent rRNA methyltransferase [Roseiflexaceae bacterium]
MAKRVEIQLPTNLRERLAQGHPWVYRNHVPIGVRLETGTWVRVRCGSWAGYGLWDAEGPIAIRIYSERQVPDTAWLRAQVRAAWDLREPVRATGTTAYRWLFGEGDGLPGLTVDRYGEYAVVAAYSAGAATLLAPLAEALAACDPALRGVVQRLRPDDDEEAELVAAPRRMTRDGRQRRIGRLWGQEPPNQLIANEHGLRFEVDLQAGQKTGLFLDQRENRRYLEQISAGRRVLNCFAYTGAFSMYALRGGASEAVSVDIGKGLAESAANNLRLSGLDPRRHRFITADCFELLNRYAEQGQQFDIVILDPPSFAKSKQNRYAALRAYTKLNALGLRCVAEGGILISSSCTSQVGPEAFRELLGVAAAQADRRLQILHEAGHASDHPVPAHFPEGRYLKFIAAHVREVP